MTRTATFPMEEYLTSIDRLHFRLKIVFDVLKMCHSNGRKFLSNNFELPSRYVTIISIISTRKTTANACFRHKMQFQ